MPSQFDIKAARAAGYNDDEIKSFLSQYADVDGAMNAGYSLDEIANAIDFSTKPIIPVSPAPQDEPSKPIIAVAPAPQGEPSQKGYAQVIELPEQQVIATPLPSRSREEEREMKRVKEYVDTQRFYARQREIPRIGPQSPEERAGIQMEMIAEGIRRNPFINPLATTMRGLEVGIEGAKRVKEGITTIGEAGRNFVNVVTAKLPSNVQMEEIRKLPKEVRKGILKTILGSAEIALGAGQILSPEVMMPIAYGSEVAPEATQALTAPVTTLTKPQTEEEQLTAMAGDIAYQALLLGMAKSLKPKGRVGVKLSTEEAELGLARAEAGDVRVRNMQEANIAEQIKNDIELRKQAKADLQKMLDKELSDAEFDAMLDEKIAQKREYQEPAELLIPSGKSEVLPSLPFDAEGKPIPIQPVREARAPLRAVEIPSFPYEGPRALPPEQLAKVTGKLPPVSTEPPIPTTKMSALNLAEIEMPVARAVEATMKEGSVSSGWHSGFSQEFNNMNPRWAIVYEGAPSKRLVNAAEKAGLEVSTRKTTSGDIFTDVTIPEHIAGRADIKKAQKIFNTFADIYTKEKRTAEKKLPPSFRQTIIKELGGEEIETRLGKVKELSDSELIRIAKERKVRTKVPTGDIGVITKAGKPITPPLETKPTGETVVKAIVQKKDVLSNTIGELQKQLKKLKTKEPQNKKSAEWNSWFKDYSKVKVKIEELKSLERNKEKALETSRQFAKTEKMMADVTPSPLVPQLKKAVDVILKEKKFKEFFGESYDKIKTDKTKLKTFREQFRNWIDQYYTPKLEKKLNDVGIKVVNGAMYTKTPQGTMFKTPLSGLPEMLKRTDKPSLTKLDGILRVSAGSMYGVEMDDDGNVKINPIKFALGMLAGAIVLNPNIRAKLAKTVGKGAEKLTDAELVKEYNKKTGADINERKGGIYVQNVMLKRFPDQTAIIEAVTGMDKKDILAARRQLTIEQAKQLATQHEPLIRGIREGKIQGPRAYTGEEMLAIQSELTKIVEEKKEFKNFDEGDKRLLKAVLGGYYESGFTQRILQEKVSPELAKFFKTFDPSLDLPKDVPPGVLSMLAEVSAIHKLSSTSPIPKSLFGNLVSRSFWLPDLIISSQFNKVLYPLYKYILNPKVKRDRFLMEAAFNHLAARQTLKDAVKTAVDLVRGEESALAQNIFLQNEGYESRSTLAGRISLFGRKEIFGKDIGTLWATPLRLQGAIDVLIRIPMYDKISRQLSIREAIMELGAKKVPIGDIMKRADDIFNEMPQRLSETASRLADKAMENAKTITFQERGGATQQFINKIRSHPAARNVMVFFTTMSNLGKWAWAHSPFAPISARFIQAAWESLSRKSMDDLTYLQESLGKITGRQFTPGQIGELSDALGKMITGSATMGTVFLFTDYVLDGNVTGYYPKNPVDRRLWEIENKQEFSIKLPYFGYVGYRGFEPIATYFAAYANYIQAKRNYEMTPEEERTWYTPLAHFAVGMMMNWSESVPFIGIKYIIDVFSAESGETEVEKAATTAANFLTSLALPNIIIQSSNVVDPRVRKPEGIAEKIATKVPFATYKIRQRQTALGEPMRHDYSATRFLGFTVKVPNEDVVNKELVRLKFSPAPPTEEYAGLKLTQDQINELQNIAGKHLKGIYSMMMVKPDGTINEKWSALPEQIKINLLTEVKSIIYRAQRESLFPTKQFEGKINKLPEIESKLSAEEKEKWMKLIQEMNQ